MKAKRIKDKDGKEIVIAKDGRRMNPNSLKNMKSENGFQKHPENINADGRNQFTEAKPLKDALIETLKTPMPGNEKKQKLIGVCEKIIDTLLNTDNEHTVRQLGELLLGHIDGKIETKQPIGNAIIAQNVILLPPKQDSPGGQVRPDTSTDEEEVDYHQ